MPIGLKIKKSEFIIPLPEQFNKKWNSVLFNAEKSLLELLLTESVKVFAKIETDLLTKN